MYIYIKHELDFFSYFGYQLVLISIHLPHFLSVKKKIEEEREKMWTQQKLKHMTQNESIEPTRA